MSTEEPSGEHNLASTSGPSRPLFTLRALVSTQQSGLIIGKEGQNVKQLRSEVNCRVKVSEHVEDSYERILSVSADTCEDVVKAYSVILNKLKQEGRSREVTLLIPHQQMGSIIGKQGARIKELQKTARCSASESLLYNSTDRALTVGFYSAAGGDFMKVIENVCNWLFEHKDDRLAGHIQYRPSKDYSFLQSRRGAGSGSHRSGSVGATESQTIKVPADLVGALIGRRGRQIEDIRYKSGASVHVASASEESTGGQERDVTISGTKQSVQKALSMVYQRLEQEKNKKKEDAEAGGEGDDAVGTETQQ